MFIEHLDKVIAIIRMTSPVLPNFFWYTSWTFDWCSIVFWNPFVVCMFLFLFFIYYLFLTILSLLAHLVELFSFALAISCQFLFLISSIWYFLLMYFTEIPLLISSICFNGKFCVKIVFLVFQCLVALEKMIKKKTIFGQQKSMTYF